MKNLKKVLSCLVTGIFAISCTKIDSVFNGNKDSNRFGIPTENVNFKISNEPIVPKILTFESKVPIKPLKLVKKLPEGKNFDFRFEVNPKKLKKNMIKISENGDFKLTIKKGNKFSVIDNDATDGNATIEIPENVINSFIGIPEKDEDEHKKVTSSITIEDKLYYAKQEIKPLSKKELEAIFDKDEKEHDKKFETKKENTEKDKENNEGWYTGEREDGTWYQIGKRPLPIPSEWKSDDGIDYVLSFKNQGIKQFDFKGYKVSNSKDYEYPDGVNLIGTKGGTVSLTGVGKIEIPEGALDKEIFISMKQEASAPEMTAYYDETRSIKESDYVSPVVRIEPVGMFLNKFAKVWLVTDTARVGSNSPAVVDWQVVYDMDTYMKFLRREVGDDFLVRQRIENKDKVYMRLLSAEGENFSKVTIDTPTLIDRLGYTCKIIDSDYKPTDSFRRSYEDTGFAIKGFDDTGKYVYIDWNDYDSLIKKYNNPETGRNTIIDSIKTRADKAYEYFQSVSNVSPYAIGYGGKVRISLVPNYKSIFVPNIAPITTGGTITLTETSNNSGAGVPRFYDDAVEHELWHTFQNSFKTVQTTWIKEGSAEHMGARAFSRNPIGRDYIKASYIENLNQGLNWSNKTFPYYEDTYKTTPFFTYLANKDTKPNSFYCNSENCDNYMTKVFDVDLLKNYHDYALHAYITDRFDVYKDNATKIAPKPTFLSPDKNNKENNKKQPTITLENNSAKYLTFNLVPTSKKNISLGLTVKTSGSGCESSSKIRVLFYDTSGNNTIVLPQYLDPNSGTEEIDSKYLNLGMFTEKKALNLKTGQIYPFLNFGEDFSKAVLIISNSNGQLGTGNTCNYEVESCLLCFK